MNNLKLVLVIISLSFLVACGGSGGSSSETNISGVASKGLIANGFVTIYALDQDGKQGRQLGITRTDAKGAYSISIGGYSGSVLVEAYGSYTDEATGLPMEIPATAPLRAVTGNASGVVALSVTPLTDLAVRQAGVLTPQNITAANARISEIFKVDIIATAPAAPTPEVFQATTTTRNQKEYALALATVSQMMQAGGKLEDTLQTLNSGISQAGMNQQTATAFTAAASSFIANPENKTGVTTLAGSALNTVGSTPFKLSIVLQGSSASAVKGVQATITLPAGVVLQADADGKILSTELMPGVNMPSGMIAGKYSAAVSNVPASVTLDYAIDPYAALSAGEVLVLNAELLPGFAVHAATHFSLGHKLVDADGEVVDGADLALQYMD